MVKFLEKKYLFMKWTYVVFVEDIGETRMRVKCNLCELVLPKDHAVYITSLNIYFCKKCYKDIKVVKCNE